MSDGAYLHEANRRKKAAAAQSDDCLIQVPFIRHGAFNLFGRFHIPAQIIFYGCDPRLSLQLHLMVP